MVDPRKTINEQQTLKFFKIDVRNKKQIEDAFAEVVECFGHVDVMVNGAAIIQESSFEETLKINTVCNPIAQFIFRICLKKPLENQFSKFRSV